LQASKDVAIRVKEGWLHNQVHGRQPATASDEYH